MSRYPAAQWAPWRYLAADGEPAFYRGENHPTAVVLHVMQGHMSTVLDWARTGYRFASWHYTVGLDGKVYQHLEHSDGGYQAGITDTQAAAHRPTWAMWRGPGVNVNRHTIGVEHEGFAGQPFTAAQSAASRDLCRWLAADLGTPLDRDHFPPHAVIDTVNRVNDFNTPALREAHYAYLFEEDEVTRAEFDALAARVAHLEQVVGLITQAPEKFLAPDGAPWNYLLRDKWLSMAIDKHIADEGAHS